MKKTLILIFSMLMLTLSFKPVQAAEIDNLPVYGENFSISMYVKEDGLVEISTSADIVFNQKRQGIFVTVPVKYSDYGFSAITGNTEDDNRTYYFPVSKFKSNSHNYVEEDRSLERVVYRLGKEGKYLTGPVRFDYSYNIQMRDLELSKGTQLFLMDLIGSKWEYPFKNIDFQIQFEKPIDGSKIEFETSERDQDIQFTYDEKTQTIKGSYNKPTGKYNALTVYVPLENGYFKYASLDHTKLGIAIMAPLMLVVVFLRRKYVVAHPVITTVGFSAPHGLNSADVGYIHKGNMVSNDVVSLIIYWADKGFLNIIEHDDKEIELIKVQDINAGRAEEVILFNELFKDRESVFISKLKNSFYTHINRAILGMTQSFTKNPERNIYNKKSQVVLVVTSILTLIMAVVMGSIMIFTTTGLMEMALIGGLIAMGVSLFIIIFMGALSTLIIVNENKGLYHILYVLLGVINIAMFMIMGRIGQVNQINSAIMTVMYAVALFQATSSLQFTEQGAKWKGEVLGLKRFIETTEIERLKMFVEETPQIFYNILPYAYVLNLTDAWAKKFETIAIEEPVWYQTTRTGMFNPYFMTRSLSRNMAVMNSTMSSAPQSTGSSGGGFSSGGSSGGGFGGGGFGGGGGGSW